MVVLGIDPSTQMGLVVLKYKGTKITTLYAGEYEAKGKKGMERLSLIGGKVLELLEAYSPDKVYVEGYSFGSKFNHEAMYSIGTVIRYFLWQSEYSYELVPPTTLKKLVIGKGVGKKELVMLNVYKNWGFDMGNNNIADAYGIAMFGVLSYLNAVSEKGVWCKTDFKDFVYDHSLVKIN